MRTVRFCFLLWVTAVFATLLTTTVALASATQTPVSLDISLPNGTVTLGEPVVLSCKVVNHSATGKFTTFGNVKPVWIKVTVTDSTEQSLQPTPKITPPEEGGIRSIGTRLGPGSSHEERLNVSGLFLFPQPGEYRITVKARCTFREDIDQLYVKPEAWDGEVAVEKEFALTVTRPNPVRLQEIASALRTQVAGNNVRHSWEALDMLFSMPEQIAAPLWRDLIVAPKPKEAGELLKVPDLLERVGSPLAVDLLAELARRNASDGVRASASSKLRIFAKSDNPVLKQRAALQLEQLKSN